MSRVHLQWHQIFIYLFVSLFLVVCFFTSQGLVNDLMKAYWSPLINCNKQPLQAPDSLQAKGTINPAFVSTMAVDDEHEVS